MKSLHHLIDALKYLRNPETIQELSRNYPETIQKLSRNYLETMWNYPK